MRTVRVRIAVAVDKDGDWSASGWHGAKPGDPDSIAQDGINGDGTVYFVEADVPVPEAVTVEGRME